MEDLADAQTCLRTSPAGPRLRSRASSPVGVLSGNFCEGMLGLNQLLPWTRVEHFAAALLAHLNGESSHDRGCKVTVEQTCEHFEQKELRSGDSFRSFATVKTYRGYIRKWIKPRWGSFCLDEVKAVDVEAWLRRLPMARSSRAKIRNVLSILFNHACRYELFDRNPMRFVRQGAKRRSAPVVLTALEIRALVDHLALRERTLR